MEDSFPEAIVTGYEELIHAMKNDTDDRHVLAATVRCGAHAIVSNNTKRFARQAHHRRLSYINRAGRDPANRHPATT